MKLKRKLQKFRKLSVESLEQRLVLAGAGSIAGIIWNDLDGDGQRGQSEPLEANIPVFLDLNGNGSADVSEPLQATAADGSYAFSGLDAGNYIVRHTPPVNHRITSPTVSGRRLFVADTSTNPDRIVELDAATGAELRSFAPPVANSSGDVGLAFDGQTLYFISNSNDTLYELDVATGAVLDSTALASGSYGGLASLDNKVYVLNWSGRVVSIFDPATNGVTTGYDLDSINSLFFTTHGLGNSAATGELVAATTSGAVAFVNATTGVKTSAFDVGTTIISIEAIGDEIFVGYGSPKKIDVYSRASRTLLRSLTMTFNPVESAGWGDTSGARRVSLTEGQAATNVDFGNQTTLVSIAGTRWQDTDGNGAHEGSEPPLAGRTMYLDLNDNGRLDNAERTVITNSNGNYLFSGLAIGKHVVREVVEENYQQTFPVVTTKRLFVTDVFESKIFELDPQSGGIINSFPTPISSQIFNGLAFDGQTIYFLSNDNDILYRINPDTGTVIGQMTLASGSYQELAFLNGLLYVRVMNSAFIQALDPVSGTIVNTVTVTGLPSAYIYYGLGEMTGPDRILARSLQSDLLAIDPATGVATALFKYSTSTPYGITSVGDEIFIGESGGSNGVIDVYSRSGVLLRSFNTAATPAAFALGGREWTDTARRVTLTYGQNATGVDFGTNEPVTTIQKPTLDAISDPAAILEDAAQHSVNLTGISGSAGTTIRVTALSSDPTLIPHPTATYAGGSSGSLAFKPVADRAGLAVITVRVDYEGALPGDLNFVEQSFTVEVEPVNDPPSFQQLTGNFSAADENLATGGPAPMQVIAGWATNIAAGPADEASQSQSLAFLATSDNQELFTSGGQPTVDLDGNLYFRPRPNAYGIANVRVVLADGGGGTNHSEEATFQIEITKPHKLHNVTESGKRRGLDVTGATSSAPDGFIVAGDVIAIINYINTHGSGHVSNTSLNGPPYCDVTGDDEVVADDALKIINYINSGEESEAEFSDSSITMIEANGDSAVISSHGNEQHLLLNTSELAAMVELLAMDTALQNRRRRQLT